MPVARTANRVSAAEVHETLARHMLADGLRIVLDLEKSHGARLHDARSGNELIDLFTCFSTCPLGFNHPGLKNPDFAREILPAAINKPSNSDLYTPEFAAFVETIARTVPPAFAERMFFISGGALAVENALKAAFDWKVRKNLAAGKGERGHQVVHLRQAFHGRSGYTLSLTNTADPRKTQYFPQFDWPRITNPKLRFPVTSEVLAEVEAAERRSLAELDAALAERGDDIAALIVEPIQGEGGDNHFRGEYLRELRRRADEREFLLIFDEIQTGFGTTGKWWCFEHFDVPPDIFAFGKKSQVCGIAATARLDEVDSVFQVSSRINSTWGGNLVDMVRARRVIEIVEEENLLDNAARVGALLLDGLERLVAKWPRWTSNARGRGMFVAFDLSSHELRERVMTLMREAGVLALRSGAEAIRFRPPLSLTEDEAAAALERLDRALAALERENS